MTSDTLLDFDILYYRRILFEIVEHVGIESVCFFLDSREQQVFRLYKQYRSLFRLYRKFGKERFEKAAERANFYNKQSPATLTFILRYHPDKLPLDRNTDIHGQKFLNFE